MNLSEECWQPELRPLNMVIGISILFFTQERLPMKEQVIGLIECPAQTPFLNNIARCQCCQALYTRVFCLKNGRDWVKSTKDNKLVIKVIYKELSMRMRWISSWFPIFRPSPGIRSTEILWLSSNTFKRMIKCWHSVLAVKDLSTLADVHSWHANMCSAWLAFPVLSRKSAHSAEAHLFSYPREGNSLPLM